jgi:hypothetical protein
MDVQTSDPDRAYALRVYGYGIAINLPTSTHPAIFIFDQYGKKIPYWNSALVHSNMDTR